MPWKRFFWKKNKVFVAVDADGTPRVQGGRVQITYKLGDDRSYSAPADALQVIPEASVVEAPIREEPAAGAAPAAKKKARAPRKAAPRKAARAARGTRAELILAGSERELELLAGASAERPPVIIHTDGACSGNPGPMGIGVVLESGTRRKEISEFLGEGTNNIAELTAVQRALEALREPERRILVYTDSEYVIGVLILGWKARANVELIADLKALVAEFPDLHFVKVLGHSGVAGNERADELARAALSKVAAKARGRSAAE